MRRDKEKMKKLFILLFILYFFPLGVALNPITEIDCKFPYQLIDVKQILCQLKSLAPEPFPIYFILEIEDINGGMVEHNEFNITSAKFDEKNLTSMSISNNSFALLDDGTEIYIVKGTHYLSISLEADPRADPHNYTLNVSFVSTLQNTQLIQDIIKEVVEDSDRIEYINETKNINQNINQNIIYNFYNNYQNIINITLGISIFSISIFVIKLLIKGKSSRQV